jgi:hypothetical protein
MGLLRLSDSPKVLSEVQAVWKIRAFLRITSVPGGFGGYGGMGQPSAINELSIVMGLPAETRVKPFENVTLARDVDGPHNGLYHQPGGNGSCDN